MQKMRNGSMEIVNMYKYLGVFLSTRLSFSHALQDMASRARIGTITILKTLWSLGEKSPYVFFKLFDAQVQPMLNYGAEVWGLTADLKFIERIHLMALKRFLNVSIRTPNVLVYGETGRYPLFVNVYVKCVRYWLRIQKMDNDRYPKKAYKMLKHMHEQNRQTWASSVCYLLYKYGFDEVWLNHGVGDEKAFLKTFKEHLIANYKQEWRNDIETKERFQFYRSFKTEFCLSNYLNHLKNVKARNDLIRLRLGVSQLKTHLNRFSRFDNHNTSCPFCEHTEETEVHFMFICPVYEDLREYYIPHKFLNRPCLFTLDVLLATESKYFLIRQAMYVKKALERRSFFLKEKLL